MAAQQDPYVRVYYRVIDDPKFRDVFDDDARLACWLRLLLIADGTYPAPAPIPAGVRRGALQHLVTVGLIDLEAGGRYRIHGMDGERGARGRKAADAAAARWSKERGNARSDADAMQTHSGRNAGASDTNMHSAPLLSAPLLSTPLRAETRAQGDANWRVIQLVESLTDRQFSYSAGSPAFDTLTQDVAALGVDRVAAEYRSLRAESEGAPMDAAQLVFGAHKRLFPIPSAPKPVAAPKGMVQDISEIRRALDAR